MTDEEVNAAIVRDLTVDTYEIQSQEMIPYKGKKLAFGMESTIFTCPKCRKIGTLHTDDDHLYCGCGFRAAYDVYGYLTESDGTRYTITGLDTMQKELLAEKLTHADQEMLFSDQVRLQDIDDNHVLVGEKSGRMTAYADRLEICGTVIPYSDILGMTIYSRNVLVIHTLSDSRHYEVRSDLRFSALKYFYLYNLFKKEC